jgi:hypothetical protein
MLTVSGMRFVYCNSKIVYPIELYLSGGSRRLQKHIAGLKAYSTLTGDTATQEVL